MPAKTDVLRVRLVSDGAGKVRAEMLGVDDSFRKVGKSSTFLSSGIAKLSGLLGTLSVTGFALAVKGSLSFADSIDKAAKAAAVSTEFLQELRFAGDQLGVSTKLIDEGFRRFGRRLGKFVNDEGGPAADAIKKLGINVFDAQDKFIGAEASFDKFVEKFETLPTFLQKSAFAAEAFGDDAGPKLALALAEGTDGIARLRQEARDLGLVLSDELIDGAVESSNELSKMTNVIKTQLTQAFLNLKPVILTVTSSILALTTALSDFFTTTKKEALSDLTKRAKDLTDELARGSEGFIKLSKARRTAIVRELTETGAAIGVLKEEIKALDKEASKKPLEGLVPPETGADAEKLAKQLAQITDRLNPLQARAKQYATELKTITSSNIGLAQQAELIQKLDKEFADATGGPKQFNKEVAKVGPTAEAAASETQQVFNRAGENIQRAFGDTFTDIFRNGITKFEDLTDALRDIFARLAGEIAAMLVFRPQLLGSAVGGLGLFGSAGAAGGTGAAAGGLGGFLAGGSGSALLPLALAAGGGLGGILGGNALSNMLGLNASRAGNAGGLLGALGGSYGGLLLGSATGLGPLGIPLGALLGGLGGSVLGNLFGGGGNNKQKFGFNTGAGGVQTPFGGLSVSRSQNIDADAIVRSLAGIDKSIAKLLDPEQIARVRGALSGTGQFFSAHSFDNESFDVVKTRLVRIIDAVAENTVASGLLNQIGRDPGNIDQLIGEAGRIIELINMFGEQGEPLNNAELALQTITEQFKALSDVAVDLGFSVEEVNERLAKATQQLTTDFNASISDQILAIEQPFISAMEAVERAARDRLDNAKTLGADLVEVERLNGLDRQKILDQFFGSSNSSLLATLTSLTTTGAGGLSIGSQVSNSESIFNTLLSDARSDPSARSSLASFLPGFINLKREQLGSSAEFFEFTNFLDSVVRGLVDQTDTVTTLNDVGAAITTGDNAIVTTLQEEIGSLKQEIVEMNADIKLLLNAPAAA